TTRKPNGYGGGGELTSPGDQLGGIGGSSKGTIELDAGKSITLKARSDSTGGSGSNNNKSAIQQLLKLTDMMNKMNPFSQLVSNLGGKISDMIGGGLGGASGATIHIQADGTIAVKSDEKIVLQGGDSKITIDQTGISIAGMTVTIGDFGSTMAVIVNGDEVNISKNVTVEGGFEIVGIGLMDGAPIL